MPRAQPTTTRRRAAAVAAATLLAVAAAASPGCATAPRVNRVEATPRPAPGWGRPGGSQPLRTPRISASGFDDRVRLTRNEAPDKPPAPALNSAPGRDPGPPTGRSGGPKPETRPGAIVPGPASPPSGRPAADDPTEGPDPPGPADDSPPAPGFPDGVRVSQNDRPRVGRPGAGRDDAAGGGPGPERAESDRQPDTNLDRPRAQRRGGGGGPTRAEDDEDSDNDEDEFKSDLLMRALGLTESPVQAFGWLQGSLTGNPANPRDGQNFGVFPNNRANAFEFQQLYFVLEKPIDLKRADEYQLGFRVDSLFGTDWSQFHDVGLLDRAFPPNGFGYDPVQLYGEVHLPWFTEGGVDVKGGRFFALPGYEDGRAPARPLNSTSYLFAFAHPFTHVGVLSTWHVADRLNLYNGVVNGWDRWIDQNYRWGYAGGLSADSKDERTNFTATLNVGPNQFPNFFRAGYPSQLVPNGVPDPSYRSRQRNPSYNRNNAILFTGVLIHQFTDALSLVVEADEGYENNITGLGPGGNAGRGHGDWFGVGAWLLYEFNDKLTGVARGDFFRDGNGIRTGFNDVYHEVTLGLIYKPKTWLWVRPEVRYDWADGAPVYDAETRKDQVTLGFDTIFLF